jgi:hypothetical protein
MMEYTFELIAIDPLHLKSGFEPLNELAKNRWKVITLVPFGPTEKNYLALLGRDKEEQAELLESLESDSAIGNTISAPAAN